MFGEGPPLPKDKEQLQLLFIELLFIEWLTKLNGKPPTDIDMSSTLCWQSFLDNFD